MSRPALLTSEEIRAAMVGLNGWQCSGSALSRSLNFSDFRRAIQFINEMADEAEVLNHHPDYYQSYRRIQLQLTTHDRGGLTELDFTLAGRINQILEHYPETSKKD